MKWFAVTVCKSKMFDKFLFGILLLHFFGHSDCESPDKENEYLFLERFSQFHCYKESICTKGGPKVCGEDYRNSVLAYFNDLCMLHRANCKKAGVYSLMDIAVCDTRYNYTITFADELLFEPIVKINVTINTAVRNNPNEGNTSDNITDPGVGDPSISNLTNIGDLGIGPENSSRGFPDETLEQTGTGNSKLPKAMRLINKKK